MTTEKSPQERIDNAKAANKRFYEQPITGDREARMVKMNQADLSLHTTEINALRQMRDEGTAPVPVPVLDTAISKKAAEIAQDKERIDRYGGPTSQ